MLFVGMFQGPHNWTLLEMALIETCFEKYVLRVEHTALKSRFAIFVAAVLLLNTTMERS